MSKELLFLKVVYLADIFYERIVQKRLDFRSEILPIDRVDLRRYFQRNATAFGDFNGTVRSLLRRNPSEKCEILAAIAVEAILVAWQPMMDRG